MKIFPAIDLLDGNCVQLCKGEVEFQTIYDKNPVARACRWLKQGAEWLHIVNLNGTLEYDKWKKDEEQLPRNTSLDEFLDNLPNNLQWLFRIRNSTKIPLQFSGGLRSLENIELVVRIGVNRVALGTVTIENPEIVSRALDKWGPEIIAVRIDARNGYVTTHGWKKESKVQVIELARKMAGMGLKYLVYTDILRDGMLKGVNIEEAIKIARESNLLVIASGGVSDIDDIEKLRSHEKDNIMGVIIGQAIYRLKRGN